MDDLDPLLQPGISSRARTKTSTARASPPRTVVSTPHESAPPSPAGSRDVAVPARVRVLDPQPGVLYVSAGTLLRFTVVLMASAIVVCYVVAVAQEKARAWPLRDISYYTAISPGVYLFRIAASIAGSSAFLCGWIFARDNQRARRAPVPELPTLWMSFWLSAAGILTVISGNISSLENMPVHLAFAVLNFISLSMAVSTAAFGGDGQLKRCRKNGRMALQLFAAFCWGVLIFAAFMRSQVLHDPLGLVSTLEWVGTAGIFVFCWWYSFLHLVPTTNIKTVGEVL